MQFASGKPLPGELFIGGSFVKPNGRGSEPVINPATGGHWVYTRAEDIAVGAQLARVELRVMLQEWLPRIPEFRIANEAGAGTPQES